MLGPANQDYVRELLTKESAWLRYIARRAVPDTDDRALLRKADAIDQYLRNGPAALIPEQARLVIEALETSNLTPPVSDAAARATWKRAVGEAKVALEPYTRVSDRSPKYRFRRG